MHDDACMMMNLRVWAVLGSIHVVIQTTAISRRVMHLAMVGYGLACVARVSAAAGPATALLQAHFPSNALVLKLEANRPASASGVQREARWLAEPGLVLVTSAAPDTVPGNAPQVAVPFLDLAFRLFGPNEDHGWARLGYRDEQWYGSTFWSGPDWTRVGKDWQHPGESSPSVRCFRAPRAGRVSVSGRVFKRHLDGDGVRVSLWHGDRQIWQAEIEGRDSHGVEPKVTLEAKQGDAIRFMVHKRGAIFCDTTHWDPVIQYADGETFQASKSFSKRQGEGGWFYEMPRPGAGAFPSLHALDADFSVRASTLAPGRPFAAVSSDTVGLFALADGNGNAGLVLAIDSAGPWLFHAELGRDGVLRLVGTAVPQGGKLPAVALAASGIPGLSGCPLLEQWSRRPTETGPLPELRGQFLAAYQQLAGLMPEAPEPDLLLMAQAEWRREDRIDETDSAYAAAVTNHLGRARRLLADLRTGREDAFLAREAVFLNEVAVKVEQPGLGLAGWRKLYLQTRGLKRFIAFQNPLLDFGSLLFCQRVPPSYSHLVGQYFGWRQRPGGGIFVLDQPGCSLRARNLTGSQLPAGSFLAPCLSYDARKVLFSFVACPPQPPDSTRLPVNEQGDEAGYFHIYEIGADGGGLRQLTRGTYDDLMPAALPDGGIAFCSTRRRGYSRCFGPNFSRRWHSFTLHRMAANGDDLRVLSVNDVSEWFPAVANDGRLLFARWDYIDRDAVTHQNLWAMRPDGSNPVAIWGNATPLPHCVFQARPIPGSDKIVFIASAHHSLTAGPVCVLDPGVDPNRLDAIQRITPGPFPEAESMQIPEYYESPWPLSEKYFLAAYSADRLRFEGEHLENPNPDPALGLYLLDAAGNRELIYRHPRLGSTSPIPLVPRPLPTALPPVLAREPAASGEMIISDIYQGLGPLPRGAIKQLRIIQIFPKTTWLANEPRIGFAGEENARAILGTVPVESDGSARFLVPAHAPVLFQALDRDGFALQTMRSTTSVQPGERTACIGCHEHRMSAPPPAAPPLALARAPSPIEPGEVGGEPFSFVRFVQPVLDRHCVRCHGGEKTEKGVNLTAKLRDGFTMSYWTLCGAPGEFDDARTNPEKAAAALVPRFGQRNQVQTTPPGGSYGALGSRLLKMLRAGHQDLKLPAGDLRRLAAWVDCNAVFHGTYETGSQNRQLSGQPVPMPPIQ